VTRRFLEAQANAARAGLPLLLAGTLGLSIWPGTPEAEEYTAPEAGIVAEEEPEWDLPRHEHEAVDAWVRKLLSPGWKWQMRIWMERSGRYMPMIQEELRARDMPTDLAYLALVESGFTPKAFSPAKASGLWQFMSATGRRYGLEITPMVDERRDPVRATDAALRHLSDLHRQFGSWYLAAAAYNAGSGRVQRALAQCAGGRRGAEDLYWRIRPCLPQETSNYVPFLIAAATIAKSPERYGLQDISYHAPLAYDEVAVPAGVMLDEVANLARADVSAVKNLNTHVMRDVVPEELGRVRVPAGRGLLVADGFAALTSRRLRSVAKLEEGALRPGSIFRATEVEGGDTKRFGQSHAMAGPASAFLLAEHGKHDVYGPLLRRHDDRRVAGHEELDVRLIQPDRTLPAGGCAGVVLFVQPVPSTSPLQPAANRRIGIRWRAESDHLLAQHPLRDCELHQPGRVGRHFDACAGGDMMAGDIRRGQANDDMRWVHAGAAPLPRCVGAAGTTTT
jgi:membrane-bound lytic murein transglycosylase D